MLWATNFPISPRAHFPFDTKQLSKGVCIPFHLAIGLESYYTSVFSTMQLLLERMAPLLVGESPTISPR